MSQPKQWSTTMSIVSIGSKLLAAVAMVAALACNTAAQAADVTVKKIPNSKFYVVVVEGDILDGDSQKFEAATRKLPNGSAVVALHSAGGRLEVGLNIGVMIRNKGFSTYAGKCASVCALAWLAGTQRFVDKDTALGFHSAFNIDKEGKYAGVTGGGNALVGAYLARVIGLSYDAILALTDTDPQEGDGIMWLDPKMATKYGIRFSVLKS
jgi:hypothetical protein